MAAVACTPSLSRAALTVVAVLCTVAVACDDPGLSGSPICRRGATRIVVFQGPDGTCIPRSRIVGYLCAGSDPVVVFDAGGGSERRFLGGAFSIEVPRLPATAEVVGVGDGAQLVAVPDEPRRLYSVRGSTIERWLALPPASTISDPPQAFMLGDSLLDGGAPALIAALPEWTIEIDATNGRGTAAGAAIAEGRVSPEQVVVVELGTNDRSTTSFASNALRVLSAFRSAPFVLWQNVQGPPDVVPAAEINAELEALAGRHPNVAIADWDGGVPEEYLFDGVHPDADHQDAVATVLGPLLQRWHDAVVGRPSCE